MLIEYLQIFCCTTKGASFGGVTMKMYVLYSNGQVIARKTLATNDSETFIQIFKISLPKCLMLLSKLEEYQLLLISKERNISHL